MSANPFLQAANCLGLLGYVVVGRKWRWGWWVALVSEVFWVVWGALAHSPGIYPWAAAWSAIAVLNWFTWGRKRAVHS